MNSHKQRSNPSVKHKKYTVFIGYNTYRSTLGHNPRVFNLQLIQDAEFESIFSGDSNEADFNEADSNGAGSQVTVQSP